MKANAEFVAYRPEEDTEWSFAVPIQADSASGLYEETLTLISDCYEAYSDFVTPTEVEFLIRAVESDLDIVELADLDTADRHTVKPTLSSRDGIGDDELRGVIGGFDRPSFPYKRVPSVKFVETEVVVELADGAYTVGKTSPKYLAEDGSDAPARAPLEVEIESHCYGDTPMHSVEVFLNTDIWFEDIDVGAANRLRLREFLERMAGVLDATEVDYWSNSHEIPFEIEA